MLGDIYKCKPLPLVSTARKTLQPHPPERKNERQFIAANTHSHRHNMCVCVCI